MFQFFGWGSSLCIMSAFTSFTGIAIFRFILGAFEASISPSMRAPSVGNIVIGADDQWSLCLCGGPGGSNLYETSEFFFRHRW
jgi:hypothetical protein